MTISVDGNLSALTSLLAKKIAIAHNIASKYCACATKTFVKFHISEFSTIVNFFTKKYHLSFSGSTYYLLTSLCCHSTRFSKMLVTFGNQSL
jgi:hypothetical protein